MTNDTTKAITPHPSGITGLIPGIATSSLAVGGGAVEGYKIVEMKASGTKRPTTNIAIEHTQRDSSP